MTPSAKASSRPWKYEAIIALCTTLSDSPPRPKSTRPANMVAQAALVLPPMSMVPTAVSPAPATSSAMKTTPMRRTPRRSASQPPKKGSATLGHE